MSSFFAQTTPSNAYLHEWTSLPSWNPSSKVWYADLLEGAPKVMQFAANEMSGLNISLADVFAQRRSVRRYASRAIEAAKLGTILQQVAPFYAPLQSGLQRPTGGTHCLLMPLVLQGHEVAAGAYAYAPDTQHLHLLKAEDPRPVFTKYCFQQEFTNAPVILLLASSLQYSVHGGDRGYRHALLDAGKLMQRLYFAATTAGLVGSVTGSFIQPEIGRWLGLDGYTHTILAGFALGYAIDQGDSNA